MAALFRLSLKPPSGVVRTHKPNAHTVIILPRTAIVEDVRSTIGQSEDFRFLMTHGSTIKAVSAGYLPPILDSNVYLDDDPKISRQKEAYRNFLKQMWASLRASMHVDAVLTGSFSYYAERELAIALEELGLPFIVLQKENLKTPGLVNFFGYLYRDRRGPFGGRRILVYNEIERQLQIHNGIVGPDRVKVVGMPRLDRIHDWRRRHATDPAVRRGNAQILFFDFAPRTGLPVITRKQAYGAQFERLDDLTASLGWNVLSEETRRTVIVLAKENPALTVTIKTKGRLHDDQSMIDLLDRFGPQPSNLRIVSGGDPFELIAQSDVICGFNSTALLEGLAAGKDIIIPNFGEVFDEHHKPYVVDYGNAAEHADSPEDLTAQLRLYASERPEARAELGDAAMRVLYYWVGNSDGKAGERFRQALIDEMGSAA